jgi:hypothetical protein
MAQTIILKRSGLAGKVPDTGSLNLGEVAINTFDGKVFFKRSGSVESIQEILTTNSTITGSLSMSGTGSFASLKVNDTLTVSHGTTIISGSQLVTDELTVLGAINARQFNISVVSSSVIYQSGSTKFGDTSDDIHSFTGSLQVSGSQNINGNIYLTGSLIPSGNFVYDLGSETNSFKDLFLSTGSIRFHNPDGTEQGRITVDKTTGDISLLKTAGLTNEQKATISQGNINPNFLTAVSASNIFVQNKIVTAAEATINGINLTTFSSSLNSRITTLGNLTGSYATTGSNIFSGSQTITGSLGITGSVSASTFTGVGNLTQFSSSLDARIVSASAGGNNTFDFNLEPSVAGQVGFIEDISSNTQVIAQTDSMQVIIASTTYLSMSANTMNITTGSITANYMHLAKYINNSGDLDFNV